MKTGFYRGVTFVYSGIIFSEMEQIVEDIIDASCSNLDFIKEVYFDSYELTVTVLKHIRELDGYSFFYNGDHIVASQRIHENTNV